MRKFAVFCTLFIGFMLMMSFFYLVAAAVPNGQEAPLNPSGGAFELNVDGDGRLWISDYDAEEIWQVEPASGVYTVYENIPLPVDARRDASGFVWWGDNGMGRFGRLEPGSGQVDFWDAPGASALFGTQIDGSGKFWVLAFDDPYLYGFNPVTQQLCSYTLPESGIADYPLAHDGFIWLGDYENGRILRLNPTTDEFTIWQLPTDSSPEGLAYDPYQDVLWWADPNLGEVARLRPGLDELRSYNAPGASLAQMVALRGNGVWYSDHWSGGIIGRLDPTTAVSVTQTATRTVTTAEVACDSAMPALTQTTTSMQGNLTWADQTYTVTHNSGWQIYDLPPGALPWGLAAGSEEVWFVDFGRQVLGRIEAEALVTITACKVADGDGDLATSDDRTPVEDWTLYLLIDGVRQGNGRKTAVDGCTTWADLAPDINYGVEEESPSGWVALTPTIHDWGIAGSGANLEHTFVNTRIEINIYLPMVRRGQ